MEDLGALPHALLRKLLEKFSKNFQNFNPIGFWVLSLYCADFDVAVFRATNSGCYEVNPASGIDAAIASLRYRIEMVQVS